MVIEHMFITTLDPTQTLSRASDYLMARGFKHDIDDQPHGPAETPTSMEMKRGKDARRAKSIVELPQRVRMEWDRGRVTVAISIGVNATWGGGGLGGSGEVARKMRLHSAILNAIARGLETLLAHDGAGVADYGLWDELEAAAKAAARRRRTIAITVLLIVLGLLATVITLAVVNS